MAERGVSVRLSARVDQYVRAMKQAQDATGAVGRDWSKVGGMMTSAGKTMSLAVTAPLVGAGAAAVKMSNDFDTAFSQMVGLAGVPAGEVDELKESVLGLAGETARAPMELAEALYFAASAGLDSAAAMDAVEVAAVAAAAGLGSTQDIVGLVASAVASYGKEAITAAEATDILTATIREGRADPDELAGTLGRVLPIASQLGIEFSEVGGTVAYLSNVFGDTNRTVTATNGLLVKLVSPTKQGRAALADMGTSLEELHAAIDERGLLGALDLLRQRGFAENQTALRSLFDDIEGYQAALALLNADQAQLTQIMEATANSTGATQEAFDAIDEEAQSLRQAWVDIQIALIQVGEILAPIIADIAGGIASLANSFTDLDPAVQIAIVAVAGMAAAAGPLLVLIGSLIRNFITLKGAIAGANFAAAAGTFGAVALAITVVAGAWYTLTRNSSKAEERMAEAKRKMDDLKDAAEDLRKELEATDDPMSVYRRRVRDIAAESPLMRDAMKEAGVTIDDVAAAAASGDEHLNGLTLRLKNTALQTGATREETEAFIGPMRDLGDMAAITGNVLVELAEVENDAAAAIAETNEPLEEQIELSAEAERIIAEGNERLEEARERNEELRDAILAHVEALEAQVAAYRGAADAGFALRDAEDRHADAIAKLDEALVDEEATLRDIAQAQDAVAETARDVADAHVRVAQEAAATNGAVLSEKDAMDAFNESLLDQAAAASGPARKSIVDYIAAVNGIPEERATEILTLLDEGKVEAAEAVINWTSRTRPAAIVADAQTARAEEMLNHVARVRTAHIQAMLGISDQTGRFGRNARGTSNWRGGWTLVGEEGPELAHLPRGTSIYPAAETQQMLAGVGASMAPATSGAGGGGGVLEVNVTASTSDGRRIGDAVVESIKRWERANGTRWRN